MSGYHLLAVVACALVNAGQASPALQPDAAIACDACSEWNVPRAPFRVFGNTYYVGVAGLSAILVERGTPGVTYNMIDTFGHRLTPNSEIIF